MEGLIVLHGAPRPSGFALWAEGVFVPHDGRDRHPRALEPKELLEALSAEGLASPVSARTETALLTLVVPAVHGRPVPSAPALREPADYAPPFSAALRIYEVPSFVLPVAAALATLLALPAACRAGNRRHASPLAACPRRSPREGASAASRRSHAAGVARDSAAGRTPGTRRRAPA